jgi:hypothetical protein
MHSVNKLGFFKSLIYNENTVWMCNFILWLLEIVWLYFASMQLCNTRVLSHGINFIISRYSHHSNQISGCRLNISHFTDSNWSEGERNGRLTYFTLEKATSNAWMVPVTERHYVTHDKITSTATFQNVNNSAALLPHKLVRKRWKIFIYWLDNCVFLGYYAACSGNSLPTYQGSRIQDSYISCCFVCYVLICC